MYRFTARSSAPIQYLDSDAKRLLRILGKDDGAQGIVTRAQLPGAVEALQHAIAQDQDGAAAQRPASDGRDTDDSEADAEQAGHVPLRHRALPLLQLLQAAQAADEDVVWEV